MSNTKFIKVAVSGRLPKKEKWYHVIGEDGNVDLCPFRFNEFFATDTIGQREVKFWLEEVPDLESELIEMLERAKQELYNADNLLASEIRQLLESVKQSK